MKVCNPLAYLFTRFSYVALQDIPLEHNLSSTMESSRDRNTNLHGPKLNSGRNLLCFSHSVDALNSTSIRISESQNKEVVAETTNLLENKFNVEKLGFHFILSAVFKCFDLDDLDEVLDKVFASLPGPLQVICFYLCNTIFSCKNFFIFIQ